MIPPTHLLNILKRIQTDLRRYSYIHLPVDPTKDLWSYYGTTRVSPVALQDHLIITLAIPLANTQELLVIKRAHILPAVHFGLNKEFA